MSNYREGIRRAAGLLSAALVCSCSSAVFAAEVAITAVKKNGSPITPTSVLQALPGDSIEAELWVSNWADELPDGVRAFNLVLEGRKGAASGANDFIFTKGWKAAVIPPTCSSVADCEDDEICQNLCVQPGHDPAQGAFLDESRPNYLLLGFLTAAGVNVTSLDFIFFGQAFDSEGTPDPGKPLYAGSLIFEVDEFACGSFRFQLAPCEVSFLVSVSPVDIVYPTLVPLIIQLPDCPVLPLTSDPINCALDARIPHPQGSPQTSLSWNAIDLFFSGNPAGLTTASFRTREVPTGTAPTVNSVSPLPANGMRVSLSTPIDLLTWTCLEHRPSSREICIAPFPGDSNQDGVADPDDIIALTNDLRALPNVPHLPLALCDINRSGRCTPQDLLMAVDLLGGHGFDPWNGVEWDLTCPSTGQTDSRAPRGACCDQSGRCSDNVLEAACPVAEHDTWIQDAYCCEVPCFEPIGACCDMGAGECQNGIPESNCTATAEDWSEGVTCAQVSCLVTRGACCNVATGGCADGLTREQCSGANSVWLLGYECGGISCVPR